MTTVFTARGMHINILIRSSISWICYLLMKTTYNNENQLIHTRTTELYILLVIFLIIISDLSISNHRRCVYT